MQALPRFKTRSVFESERSALLGAAVSQPSWLDFAV